MCSSKTKLEGSSSVDLTPTTISHIDGRPVLQPNCSNRTLPLLDRRTSSLKKASKKSSTPLLLQPLSSPTKTTATTTTTTTTPPISPKLKSPRPPAIKRSSANDPPNGSLNSSNEKLSTVPKLATTKSPTLLKKSKSNLREMSSMKYSSSLIVEAPGSIAAARREQVANMQVQRKMRTAHYGRTKSAKYEGKVVPIDTCATPTTTTAREEKRCNFITPNSDPIYVAYHDEEWGVPAHDDKLLFELLVLTGAQVGSNWTSVLKKRQDFRDAFSGFDAEIVSKYNEKKITSISADYGIEISLVRGVVDNSKRILEVKREFGSLDKYLWGFVNHKPIARHEYKSCFKIPVKTSKSESISKDMVRRGFRLVGPTVMHSFMQAAGLTNDHLITCPRHTQCQPPIVAPAL